MNTIKFRDGVHNEFIRGEEDIKLLENIGLDVVSKKIDRFSR